MSKEFSTTPHILIVEGRGCPEIADELTRGAKAVLTANGCTYDRVPVPGPFEVPAAIRYALKAMQIFDGEGRYHGFVALACTVQGKGAVQDPAVALSVRSLQDLATEYSLAIGNGIMMAETEKQAMEQASAEGGDAGGRAAEACIEMIHLKQRFGLHLR